MQQAKSRSLMGFLLKTNELATVLSREIKHVRDYTEYFTASEFKKVERLAELLKPLNEFVERSRESANKQMHASAEKMRDVTPTNRKEMQQLKLTRRT
jgi:hypothetical protein